MASTNNIVFITKRDGTKEQLDIAKIHRVVEYACKDISGVSVSEIELKSQLRFFDGMKTTDIQETLIRATHDLISVDTPNYAIVGGRLINYHLRKEVYGDISPRSLYDQIKIVSDLGFYTKELLEWYTPEEIEKLDSYIEHDRDFEFPYAAMEAFRGKYLIRDRSIKKFYETPQFAYMLIAMTGFNAYPKDKRLKVIRDFYEMLSTGIVSLPTPILAGLRTSQKQFSSCVLIESGDSLDSINATSNAIVNYVSKKAGLGINAGKIRAKGSKVRNGDTLHTGVVPFLKLFNAAVKSCSQGGIRDGSATVYFPIWHYEIEDVMVLKNNKGTEDTRIRTMDYAISLSKLFYERYVNNEDITLFSPNDVPDMYDAFFADQEKFKELYEKAEKNSKIRKKKVNARDLFHALMIERKETGRIYIFNVDNANNHGPFKPEFAPIRQSNLCLEIALPVKEMGTDESLIALCTLGGINFGKINDPEDFRKPCEMIIRFLDALLSYQDYPVLEAQKHTRYYRPLGVGVTNIAYWFAKNGLSYNGDQKTLDMVDEYFEAYYYYLVKASVQLAKEFGPCEKVEHTRYSDGLTCVDWYKKSVDKLVKPNTRMDWTSLKEDLKTYGIRNSTVSALMPNESNSVVLNATNGIEPVRSLITNKGNKDMQSNLVVPGISRLKNKYELLWDLTNAEGYIKIASVMQKYVDQAISSNTTYNPKHYDKEEIPMSLLMKDLILSFNYGLKTLYYNNTPDGSADVDNQTDKSGCGSGGCTL